MEGTGMGQTGVTDRIRADAEQLDREWSSSDRWGGVRRDDSAEDVIRLRG